MTEASALRIGQGYDVHAFGPGDHVMLAGVRIPFTRGLRAHSDGDVALHALCDALLGALALGDIGHHFPPDDDAWADADSLDLLKAVFDLISEHGFSLCNADLTIVCEQPKLAPHIANMRDAIASVLEADVSQISVKATTTERLGFCGRGEGIAASAVVLLEDNLSGA